MSRLGIIAATEAEAKLLTSNTPKAGEIIPMGEECFVILSGMGSSHATQACERLHMHGCDHLLSWGSAGALAADLPSGSLILTHQVWNEQKQCLPVSQTMLQALRQLLNSADLVYVERDIHQVATEIANLEDKQRLQTQQGIAIVDMESASILSYAQSHGLQAAVLRCICDSSEMILPKAVLSSVNAYGQVNFAKLLWALLQRPSDVKHLLLLGQAFSQCSHSLRRCVPAFAAWTKFISTANNNSHA